MEAYVRACMARGDLVPVVYMSHEDSAPDVMETVAVMDEEDDGEAEPDAEQEQEHELHEESEGEEVIPSDEEL